MSGVHKNPTISFRISDYERREIEARIKASGMMKKTFFTRCCIYGRICVVGKKETVYMLVQTLEKMQADIHKIYDEIIEMHGKGSLEDIEITCQKCGKKLSGNETCCGVCGSKVWKR